jgi:hypothetical protein
MDSKVLGGIQLVGALIAGWVGFQAQRWDSLVLALLFLVTAIHHLTEKTKH